MTKTKPNSLNKIKLNFYYKQPHFTTAAEHFKEEPKTAFVAVDCTKHNSICEQNGVKGFPTIIYFNYGKNPQPYTGGREAKDFIKFMTNPNDPNAGKVDPREDWLDVPGNQHIYFPEDAKFDQFIQEKKKVLVMFYAPCNFEYFKAEFQ